MVAQLPAGMQTASTSAPANARKVVAATFAASWANPAFQAGWPQQVASSGTTTSCPARRRTRTTAAPSCGATVSTTQVGRRATRTSPS
jgi:hypothetical protein